MNYQGSYRRFKENATSAMLAAIEVYNKPRISYREEVVVILVLNAWELLLKAVVSKSKQSVFYPKRRGQPYRSLNLGDALNKALGSSAWPSDIDRQALKANLDALRTYRDNAVHFYNDDGFGVILYALMQTSILNFRDVLKSVFGNDLTDEITWHILPVGVHAPIDPVQYMKGKGAIGEGRSKPVREYLTQLAASAKELEDEGRDTNRLMTYFSVNLTSEKKIKSSDIVAGVRKGEDVETILVHKTSDPNRTHPYRQGDLLRTLAKRGRGSINSYVWQAIVWRFGLKDKPEMCWISDAGGLVKWSDQALAVAMTLSDEDVASIRTDYAAQLRKERC